ncbi:MAG: extracellular solute-binding protein [Thermotogae bacterium]|nr:extracellular solute-binding protein [Thermotogota bacterium]
MRKFGALLAILMVMALGIFAVTTVTIKIEGAGSPADTTRITNFGDAVKITNNILSACDSPYRIKIETAWFQGGWDDYRKGYILAFKAGKEPDIRAMGHEDIAWMADGGYILALDKYIKKYNDIAYYDVYPSLWDATKFNGKIYAIPQDTEARPLYFRKDVLKNLGWSEEKIADFPKEIESGNVTFDDLIAIAKEAVNKGLVKYGFLHRPSNGGFFTMMYYDFGGKLFDEAGNFIIEEKPLLNTLRFFKKMVDEGVLPSSMTNISWRSIHKAVVEGKALFWFGGTWHWAEWQRVAYHSKLGTLPESYEWENIGFALNPSPEKGGKPITMSHPFTYVVSSHTKYPELVNLLLAVVNSPKFLVNHALASGHLVTRTSAAVYPAYAKNKFVASVTPMLKYTTVLPNSLDFKKIMDPLYKAVQAVELGKMTPEKAVKWFEEEVEAAVPNIKIVK